ncbi:hypothetical protein TNCV_3836511 [Trichonephila clavipes]|nr:hypothetical protein TNCV_3836511 [Trichonephila clavipes]
MSRSRPNTINNYSTHLVEMWSSVEPEPKTSKFLKISLGLGHQKALIRPCVHPRNQERRLGDALSLQYSEHEQTSLSRLISVVTLDLCPTPRVTRSSQPAPSVAIPRSHILDRLRLDK